MIEKRCLQRVRHDAKIVLTCDDTRYEGRLENISLSGALASFSGSVVVRPGTSGMLDVLADSEPASLRFRVEVVHSGFSMVGVKFYAMDPGTEVRLQELVARPTMLQEGAGMEVCCGRADG